MWKRPRASRVIVWAGLILWTAAPGAAQTIDDTASGEQAFEAKDWGRVVELYGKITDGAPQDGGAWYRLGRGYEELGKYTDALGALEKALDLKFQPALTKVRMAASYAGLGKTDTALDLVDQVAASGFPLRQVLDEEPQFVAMRANERFVKALEKIDINGAPCKNPNVPQFREFDFWIGDWEVFDAHKIKVATDKVELTLKSCVIAETWTDVLGAEGRSFSRYNAPMKQWEQYWVDEGPTRMFLTGHYLNGVMKFEAEGFTNSGVSIRRRVSFSSLSDGSVRQFAEISRNSGKTYQVEYDLTYRRKD